MIHIHKYAYILKVCTAGQILSSFMQKFHYF